MKQNPITLNIILSVEVHSVKYPSSTSMSF